MTRIAGLLLSVLLVCGAGLAGPSTTIGAQTFTVNRIGDASDLSLANSVCDTSTNSGNQCTLRAAIEEANDTPGVDTINFNITSTSKTITPSTELPAITQPVTINGYTQKNTSANTLVVGNNAVLKVVLDGINAGADAVGLRIQGSDVVVRGLVIQRFDGAGIELSGGDHLIAGNLIGTNATGSTARGNTTGIEVTGMQNVIGGTTPAARNLISGNAAYGLRIFGAETTETLVQGNYIGTNKAGTAALRNGSHGVLVLDSPGNTIGGTVAGAGNVVSGNGDDGIKLLGPVGGNVIQGNYIGTNAAGTAAVGNELYGVTLDESINPIVGGAVAGARNVISGNRYAGVEFVRTEGGTAQGNLIGTKADGTGDLGNGRNGVFILAADVVIGGSGSAGNVISGNADHGVWIQYSSYTGNQVLGNVIKLNEFNGVHSMSDETLVQGNLVFSNGHDGVYVHSNSQGTRITANQIYGNGGLGIDIQGGTENPAGVTSNDTDDPDTGANNRQNFPVLTSATRSNASGVTTVTGTLNSNPGTEFRIELFMAVADASGSGEGQVPLAALTITTNSGGDKGFAFASGAWPVGMVLTATATSTTAGNTSEFSANRTVVPGP